MTEWGWGGGVGRNMSWVEKIKKLTIGEERGGDDYSGLKSR